MLTTGVNRLRCLWRHFRESLPRVKKPSKCDLGVIVDSPISLIQESCLVEEGSGGNRHHLCRLILGEEPELGLDGKGSAESVGDIYENAICYRHTSKLLVHYDVTKVGYVAVNKLYRFDFGGRRIIGFIYIVMK